MTRTGDGSPATGEEDEGPLERGTCDRDGHQWRGQCGGHPPSPKRRRQYLRRPLRRRPFTSPERPRDWRGNPEGSVGGVRGGGPSPLRPEGKAKDGPPFLERDPGPRTSPSSTTLSLGTWIVSGRVLGPQRVLVSRGPSVPLLGPVLVLKKPNKTKVVLEGSITRLILCGPGAAGVHGCTHTSRGPGLGSSRALGLSVAHRKGGRRSGACVVRDDPGVPEQRPVLTRRSPL